MEDLTGKVSKTEKYYFAYGGFADVWKGEYYSTDAEKPNLVNEPSISPQIPAISDLNPLFQVAIKVIRGAWHDPEYLQRLTRVRTS
jgi:hypothetical protein